MAQAFPLSLQDKFNEAGFNYEIGNTTVESEVTSGEPKKRQIYTKAIDRVSGTIELEIDEWTTLETFYKTTLAGGSLTFLFDHPLTGVETEYRFVNPPSLRPLGGRYFRVNFNWIEVG